MTAPLKKVFYPGDSLPSLHTGRWTSSHLARWCAAQQNWHKVHFDHRFAHDVDHLPDLLINGALKQHLLVQFVYEAFEGRAWPWRLNYRFDEADFVGQRLEVRGNVTETTQHRGLNYCHIEASIWNLDRELATTTARCIAIVNPKGSPVLAAPEAAELPKPLTLSDAVELPAGPTPPEATAQLGHRLADTQSYIPVDLSRLRLFAEALGCLRDLHYDPESARRGPYRTVAAPPLYPLHGIELRPGSLPLSEEPDATGRESSSEATAELATRLQLPFKRVLNGGNSVEIHSLALVGEYVCMDSRLVSLKHRVGRQSGPMLILQTFNRYKTETGRMLLSERQTGIYR